MVKKLYFYKGNKLQTFTNRMNNYTKKCAKFVPIIGVVLLTLLFISNERENNNSVVSHTNNSVLDFINSIFLEFVNSFDFSDPTQLFTTILLITTIWTGYKYWLIKIRVIRTNVKLVDNLVFAKLFLVIVAIISLSEKVIS